MIHLLEDRPARPTRPARGRSAVVTMIAAFATIALLGACGGSDPGDQASRRSSPKDTSTTAPDADDGDGADDDGANASGADDPYFPAAGDSSYDVESYDVTASVTIAGVDHLEATATIAATANVALASFDLDLKGLDVTQVTIDDQPATWSHENGELTITPGEAIDAGSEFTTVVQYAGDPSGGLDPDTILDVGGGWLDLGDYSAVVAEPTGASTWIPSNDHPSDKATFAITVTVPAPLEAVSNGALIERRDEGATSTFRWAAKEPMAPYLMTLAMGDYEFVPRPGLPGVDILDAYPPGDHAIGDLVFQEFAPMISFYSGEFGDYPFANAGNVIVPGMPPTALECQTRSLFSADLLYAGDNQELVAHELAHQWFGDAVSPEQWDDIWLNEGPAVFAQWLWTENTGGLTVEESAEASYDPSDPDMDVPPADPSATEMFGTSVYVRSAIFLVELRHEMGDAKFSTLLHRWIDEHRYKNASTDDFVTLASEVNGSPVTDLSDAWLYGDELPELTI